MRAAQLEKTRKRYTYEDYSRLPEGAPYQLIGGELVIRPSPVSYHQIILRKIGFELVRFVDERGLGEILYAPIDVYLSQTETYQPDIIFISKERLDIIGEKRIEGAPDLVIEILSEATAYYDLRHKKHVYERTGVREYWIVDPIERSIDVYENTGGRFNLFSEAIEKGMVRSRILDGFEIEIEKVF